MNLSLLRLKKYFRSKKIFEVVKKQIYVRRLASFALASILIPLNVLSVSGEALINNKVDENNKVVLKMDTTSPSIISDTKGGNSITPGESKIERESREAAEAKAQAAALKAKAQRETISRERRVYADPSDFNTIYQGAEARYGVNAIILRAIHIAETGGSGSTNRVNTSGSGAQGPMQFLPSTWRRHAVDGNNDGISDINNVSDAIYTAAAYLKACGYPDVKKALWGYNPSSSYYNKVMGIARSLGY